MMLLGFLAACAASPTAPEATSAESMMAAAHSADERYIVVFKNSTDEVTGRAHAMVQARRGRLMHTYTHALKGFAAELPADEVAALRADPTVQSVEIASPSVWSGVISSS